jgi:hypothetical protein
LLGLSAVADNAAMPTEPPTAEPPKRKGRRFQFSLRTLFVVVAVIAAASWVITDRRRLARERDEAERRANAFQTVANNLVRSGIADLRGTLEFPADTPPEIIAETKRLFPKLQVSVRTAQP